MPMTIDETPDKVKKDIVEIYRTHFGAEVAKNYDNFYKDKSLKTVLISAGELMQEYAGKEKGAQLLQSILSKYHIVHTV